MARFQIRMGIPEMHALWQELTQKSREQTLTKDERRLYQKWGQALAHLAENPMHPGLRSHEIEPLSRRYGMRVWQSYLENHSSHSMRIYWVYGPSQTDITVIGLEPHPEDRKRGGYAKVQLSDID